MIFNKLFEPITINHLVLKNRIVMPAMALFYTDDYSFNNRYRAFYRERALGGVGLMVMGPLAIDEAASNPRVIGLFQDSHVGPLRDFIKQIHGESDVKIGVQLTHMGRFASFSQRPGVTSLAPSAIPSPITKEVPKAMTDEDIEEVKIAFVKAAVRAKEAGADYIELMAAGGYLIGEFLSPLTNKRTDKYGGSLENRMRFGLEVIAAVRAGLGRDITMGIRVSGHDFMDGGNRSPESVAFCAAAEKSGVDCVDVTGGWHETQVPQITGDVPPGAFVYLARAIKKKVGIPVFASNHLGDPYLAEKVLRSDSVDMNCWGRPLIADPDLPNKVRSGRLKEIVPCISCNQGCFDALFTGASVTCTVNPRVGRESDAVTGNTSARKCILVAGGGPAGMEFALVAAQRGHEVTLYEKGKELGGQMNLVGVVPGKEEFLLAVESLKNRLALAGVDIYLDTALTAEMVEKRQPDVVAVAVGAKPASFNIKGTGPSLVSAWDILAGTASDIGTHVVIIGGGATGCETARFIAGGDVIDEDVFGFLYYHSADDIEELKELLYKSSRQITVIDIAERLAANVGPSTRWPLLKHLKLLGVTLRPSVKILSIGTDGVLVESDGKQEHIPADTIIVATGSQSFDDLSSQIKGDKTEVIILGDAKEPRKVTDAIREGFEAALGIDGPGVNDGKMSEPQDSLCARACNMDNPGKEPDSCIGIG